LSSKIVSAVNPDIIDINFGCPVKSCLQRRWCWSFERCRFNDSLNKSSYRQHPFTGNCKTRLGWDDNSINIDEVAERLQDIGVAALSIHARTRAQMYKGHSDWSHIARVKNNPRITMPIFEWRHRLARKSVTIKMNTALTAL
jgi:tRNA-dihydrouridine synthase